MAPSEVLQKAVPIERKIEEIEKNMQSAVNALSDTKKDEAVNIIHHNDADGLSSAAVLELALTSAGYKVQRHCLERTYIKPIEEIYRKTAGPAIFTDLGATIEGKIEEIGKDRISIILDHHGVISMDGFRPSSSTNFFNLNCVVYGINGDTEASASTIAYHFTLKLDEKNKKNAHLALLGPIGDKNYTRGNQKGRFDDNSYDKRIFNDALQAKYEDGVYKISLDGENFVLATNLAVDMTMLGSVGYYGNGVESAIKLIKEGYNRPIINSIKELNEKREKAYAGVVENLRKNGFKSTGDILYFNVQEKFDGMGTKTIGEFCNYLMIQRTKQLEEFRFVDPAKYIMGGQRIEPIKLFGEDFPVFDAEGEDVMKISIRTMESLREMIGKGEKPKVADLVSIVNPNQSDGCHDERGATVVRKNQVGTYLDYSQRYITDPSDKQQLTMKL